MSEFGQLKRVPLRQLWKHEGTSFTPWLAANIGALGAALGLELELLEREAAVGDFSLDLLARDLGSSRKVIIENQPTQILNGSDWMKERHQELPYTVKETLMYPSVSWKKYANGKSLTLSNLKKYFHQK